MLRSPTFSTYSRSHKEHTRGFTLVEVLVSVAILIIIASVIVFRFSSFDSLVLLKSLSYDVGLSIRSAQTYAISALGTSGDFRVPYGVSFNSDATQYTFFGYNGSEEVPRFDSDATAISVYTLGRNFTVSEVCIVVSGSENCSISRLDISFRRPEFTALFYAPGYSPSAIEAGIIKLTSGGAPEVGRVEVSHTGQITISLE